MSSKPDCKCGTCAYAAAVVGSLVIVGVLVWVMINSTTPAPLGAERAAARRKALAELRQSNGDVLNNYAWLDQSKGIVRLPIDRAMKIAEAAWQKNPAAARANLISRVEKATAVPPKAPEKPSQFE